MKQTYILLLIIFLICNASTVARHNRMGNDLKQCLTQSIEYLKGQNNG